MAKKSEEVIAWGQDMPMPDTVAEFTDMLMDNILAGIRTMVWGPPGVGKSAMLSNLAKTVTRSGNLYVLIGSMCEPTDVGGFPVVAAHKMVDGQEVPTVQFAPRDWVIKLHDEGGILFIDELPSAPPAVRAPMLRLLNEGKIDKIEFDPARVAIVGAGNPPGVSVNGSDLEPPTANRLCHFRYPTGASAIKEWTVQFPRYWGVQAPKIQFENVSVPEHIHVQARSYVANFLENNSRYWCDMPQNNARAGMAWPSPRQWAAVARAIAIKLFQGKPVDKALNISRGLVGAEASTAFLQYLRTVDFPDPMDLLKNPHKYRINDKPDLNLAILRSVVATLEMNPDPKLAEGASVILNTASAKIESANPAAMDFVELLKSWLNSSNGLNMKEMGVILGNMQPYSKVRDRLNQILSDTKGKIPTRLARVEKENAMS